jgi:hypothetical protein
MEVEEGKRTEGVEVRQSEGVAVEGLGLGDVAHRAGDLRDRTQRMQGGQRRGHRGFRGRGRMRLDLGREIVQPVRPKTAHGGEPSVDARHRCGFEGVDAFGSHRADAGETLLAQHPQLLRHRRLRDAELRPDDPDDLAGGAFTTSEQLDDPPAHRVGEDRERLHQPSAEGSVSPV